MRIHRFSRDVTDGNATMREVLGGKGANLAEMSSLGLPVPPGFTLPTEVCRYIMRHKSSPAELRRLVRDGVAHVERAFDRRFGDPENPLLLSVRSGAPISMPGMMNTVLNLGLNDDIAASWAAASGEPKAVYDAYRRFMQMFGDVVLHVGADEEGDPFDEILVAARAKEGVATDPELSAEALKQVAADFRALIKERTGTEPPDDPYEQLQMSVDAVFHSWMVPRAIAYRELHHIPDDMGTACNVQAMVFGDLGDDSATGVVFTRDPATGADEVYGEFLVNAQGEDVVAGIRTPNALSAGREGAEPGTSLEEVMPKAYAELCDVLSQLEDHFKDVQDVEFTVEREHLWILQTRAAKRSAAAAVQFAVDFVKEGRIDRRTAIERVPADAVAKLLHPALPDEAREDAVKADRLLASGLPASPGVGVGHIALTVDDALARTEAGQPVILVRDETSADDIRGMHASRAILTARGGMTSHAAVVARGMGRACVAGCHALTIDLAAGTIRLDGHALKSGDIITVDGTRGEVFSGELPTTRPSISGALEEVLSWADRFRRLDVRANADRPEDAQLARRFGAQGIGLCRTEHMFFGEGRLVKMRALVLAEDRTAREEVLESLLVMQRTDFQGMFEAMSGLPVVIRLLDPPLHEFLPVTDEEFAEVAKDLGVDEASVRSAADNRREANPMLGHRGVRLAITYPEIATMQARAILEGALAARKNGADLDVEIMVPLVADVREFQAISETIHAAADGVLARAGEKLHYRVGTMIELPRAALTADRIAEEAEFFSFGTNDLTQTTFGLSRDDAGRFLPDYVRAGLLPADPFTSLDTAGVGQLVRIAVELGRDARPGIETGICGEHGGDPASIDFCEEVGLDYVSCSPFRVPVARIAAAQAALKRTA
jgi:pyruvate,orthophosphate dikinase